MFNHQAEQAHRAALRSIARTVEETAAPQEHDVAQAGILSLLRSGAVLCVTGAGISTDSGIPDYRGPGGSLRRHRPMTFQEFKHDAAARRRYWARSFVGWRHLDEAGPNRGHEILAQWQRSGVLTGIVTQNVDGLHSASLAGGETPLVSRPTTTPSAFGPEAPLVELHGDLARVVCLTCGNVEDRQALDVRLEEANPGYAEAALGAMASAAAAGREASRHVRAAGTSEVAAENVNPDGDVTLDESWVRRFTLVRCLICGEDTLKPDVVYFGENVPAGRKAAVDELVAASSSLLVVGSSMAVMSGYSIALRFSREAKAVAVINGGPSRADAKAAWRWRTRITPALEELNSLL